jgi:hypothetical protein
MDENFFSEEGKIYYCSKERLIATAHGPTADERARIIAKAMNDYQNYVHKVDPQVEYDFSCSDNATMENADEG